MYFVFAIYYINFTPTYFTLTLVNAKCIRLFQFFYYFNFLSRYNEIEDEISNACFIHGVSSFSEQYNSGFSRFRHNVIHFIHKYKNLLR